MDYTKLSKDYSALVSCLMKRPVWRHNKVIHVFWYTASRRAVTLSSVYTHFNTLKKKEFRKTLWKKVKLLKMSNFTFLHNVFYANCILKAFDSHTSVVVCSFFEFGTVSKWCIREWVKILFPRKRLIYFYLF